MGVLASDDAGFHGRSGEMPRSLVTAFARRLVEQGGAGLTQVLGIYDAEYALKFSSYAAPFRADVLRAVVELDIRDTAASREATKVAAVLSGSVSSNVDPMRAWLVQAAPEFVLSNDELRALLMRMFVLLGPARQGVMRVHGRGLRRADVGTARLRQMPG